MINGFNTHFVIIIKGSNLYLNNSEIYTLFDEAFGLTFKSNFQNVFDENK
jgi:hypothetical protein